MLDGAMDDLTYGGSTPGYFSQGTSWNAPYVAPAPDPTPSYYSGTSWSAPYVAPAPAPAPAPAANYSQNYAPAPTNYATNNNAYGGSYYKPITANSVAPAYTPPPPPPPPVHHDAAYYRQNGAQEDATYVAQKSALLGKLNDYERQVADQIGDQNITKGTDPSYSLIGDYWKVNALPSLYDHTQDANGNDQYKSTGSLGGTLGNSFDTAISNFDNQQTNGLKNLAEGFAARGMLGSGSGVWSNARANLQDQYNNQLDNLNQSATSQYNTLLGNLANQYSQGQQTLNGYLTDASNRMATADMAGLPVANA